MNKDMKNGLMMLGVSAVIGVMVGIGIAFPLVDVLDKIERKEVVSAEQTESNSLTETLIWAGYGAWDGNPYRLVVQLYSDSEEKSKLQIEKFNMRNLAIGDERRYGMVEIYIRRAE